MGVDGKGWEWVGARFSTSRKSKANQTVNTENANADLKAFHLKNFDKLLIVHLNVNSLRNKFEILICLIKVI